MKEYKVELLVMMKHKGTFCNNSESFNKLLETNSLITIQKDKLVFQKQVFQYEILTGDVKEKEQRYFKLKIVGANELVIPYFLDLLKIIREQAFRAEGYTNILWDDLSNYYSIKAYPEINRIENLMRKLITTFMLTNIGINWTKESIPAEVKSTLKRKGKDESTGSNLLHETDFIQLAEVLFKSYSTNDINNLFKQLKNCENISDLTLGTLKEYIPKSNWERYFKVYVDCDDEYLNKKWVRLYELRCIIAHNSLLSKFDFDEINLIVGELETKIQEAIDHIDKITIPLEEKEQVMENVVTAIDERFSSFLTQWQEMGQNVKILYVNSQLGKMEEKYKLKPMIEELVTKRILTASFLTDFEPLQIFRDRIFHSGDGIIKEEIALTEILMTNFYVSYILFDDIFLFK